MNRRPDIEWPRPELVYLAAGSRDALPRDDVTGAGREGIANLGVNGNGIGVS